MRWTLHGVVIEDEDGREIRIDNISNPGEMENRLRTLGIDDVDDLILRLLMASMIMRYGPKPQLTVDGILVLSPEEARCAGVEIESPSIVLIRRGNDPYRGMYALPGGFVEFGETTEDAVIREFLEETGIRTSIRRLLGVFSDPERDPRWHTVSAVYVLEYRSGHLMHGDDAMTVELVPVDSIPERMAFDHRRILDVFISGGNEKHIYTGAISRNDAP